MSRNNLGAVAFDGSSLNLSPFGNGVSTADPRKQRFAGESLTNSTKGVL